MNLSDEGFTCSPDTEGDVLYKSGSVAVGGLVRNVKLSDIEKIG